MKMKCPKTRNAGGFQTIAIFLTFRTFRTFPLPDFFGKSGLWVFCFLLHLPSCFFQLRSSFPALHPWSESVVELLASTIQL